jgi:hypothetical protein
VQQQTIGHIFCGSEQPYETMFMTGLLIVVSLCRIESEQPTEGITGNSRFCHLKLPRNVATKATLPRQDTKGKQNISFKNRCSTGLKPNSQHSLPVLFPAGQKVGRTRFGQL